jgi:hypothetical protein
MLKWVKISGGFWFEMPLGHKTVTKWSQKPSRFSALIVKCLKDKLFRNGGGGGSRTRVRNYHQQRAFMLFRVHLCLVIDAWNGRRRGDDQSDQSHPTRSDGAGKTSLLCDDRYRPVGEA